MKPVHMLDKSCPAVSVRVWMEQKGDLWEVWCREHEAYQNPHVWCEYSGTGAALCRAFGSREKRRRSHETR